MKQIVSIGTFLISFFILMSFAKYGNRYPAGYETEKVDTVNRPVPDTGSFPLMVKFYDYNIGPLYRSFPGTDSLRAYNTQWITNNSSQAFTNYRLNTLLAGMIDWIDSARLGLGGQPGVDSIAQVNDSTFRYRKNGSFHNIVIRGGIDQNNLTTGTSFNTGTGILTTTRSGLSSLTVDLDGRYVNTILRRADSVFYTKDGVETFAFKDSTGSSGVWGLITGTLSAQTDLQTALNAKLNITDTATMLANYFNQVGLYLSKSGHVVSADSAALSGYYLRRKDSTLYVTQKKLNDTAAALRSSIGGATDISITHSAQTVTVNSNTGADGTINYAKNSLAGVLSPSNSDVGHLPEIKAYMWAKGLQASASATNYPYTLIDSNRSKFIASGPDRGGWLTNNLTGDSVQVRAPFWVVFGDSQAEGHGPTTTGRHGRLDANGTGNFDPAYPDSTGQLSYHLRFLTNMRWYNHGIGGQNTTQALRRFYRDVVGRPGTYTNADTRGNQTLWYKPQGVVIIIGINDIAQSVDLDIIKRNLELMASICQTEGIQCVMLNMPGDEVFDTASARKVETINKWMAGGVMDQYGCTVVDYNSWWKDPTANDNYTGSSLIADDIHPSKVGYDSLSNYIFRAAHLPILKRAIFINELSGGFSGYSRPTGFTIGGGPNGSPTAYTIANAIDSVNITAPVWDSTWIKTTATTNVSGTTFSGWGSVLWYTENNIDTLRVTKRSLYNNGSQKSDMTTSSVTIIPKSYDATKPVFQIPLADITSFPYGTVAYADGGTVYWVMNGLTTNARINNAILSVYGLISTNNNIRADGTNSLLSHQQICTGCSSSTWGFGLSTEGSTYSYNLQSTPTPLKDMFLLSAYSTGITGVSNWNTGQNNILHITPGFNSYASASVNSFANVVSIDPVINNTQTNGTNNQIRLLRIVPTVTALNGVRLLGVFQDRGTNLFNMHGDSTAFGRDSTTVLKAKFEVNGSMALDIGSDATGDIYYRNSGGLFTRLGIGSNGDVLTVASGLPSYAAPAGATTLYNGDGTISANRTVTGSTRNLTFTGMGSFNIFAHDFTFAKADGSVKYTGGTALSSDNIWQLGYLKGGSINAGIIIDTNNNVITGATMSTSLPLYATGGAFYASQGLQSGAGNFYKVRNITGDLTIGLTENFMTIDCTLGNVTITLPAASTAFGGGIGIRYVFKRMDASGNTITIQRAGSDTIDGGTSFTLVGQYTVKELQCTASNEWSLK